MSTDTLWWVAFGLACLAAILKLAVLIHTLVG